MSKEHNDEHSPAAVVSRRSVLAAGAVGIPGIALIGCSQAKSPTSEPAGGTSSPAGTTAGSTSAAAPSSSAAASGKSLAKLSDIKVGEAISARGPDGGDIIITRPTDTTVAAYSAICTHEGCTVMPSGTALDCPCHGSVFDLKGAVVRGPARAPLDPVKVSLAGDDVVAG